MGFNAKKKKQTQNWTKWELMEMPKWNECSQSGNCLVKPLFPQWNMTFNPPEHRNLVSHFAFFFFTKSLWAKHVEPIIIRTWESEVMALNQCWQRGEQKHLTIWLDLLTFRDWIMGVDRRKYIKEPKIQKGWNNYSANSRINWLCSVISSRTSVRECFYKLLSDTNCTVVPIFSVYQWFV